LSQESSPPSAPAQVPRPERSRSRRVIRVSLFILGAAIGLVILGIALMFSNPAPPRVLAGMPGDVERLQSGFNQAAKRQENAAPYTVDIDEGELNSYIRSQLAARSGAQSDAAGTVLTDLEIKLDGDLAALYITLAVQGKKMSLMIEGRLHSSGGYAQFDPTRARVGALPIPTGTLRSAIEQQLRDSPQLQQTMRLPSNITGLTVKDSKIVLIFR